MSYGRSKEEWLDYLIKIPHCAELSAETMERERERLIELVAPYFVPATIGLPDQDASFIVYLKLPSGVLTDPTNPYVDLILSQVPSLVTITYEWDVLPGIFDSLKIALSEGGYEYVPFSLFGTRETVDWHVFPVQPDYYPREFENMSLFEALFIG